MGLYNNTLPPQQIPYSRKNKNWRKKHLDWADNHSFFRYSAVRKSLMHKKKNYDLVNGKLNMKDIIHLVNPEDLKDSTMPTKIQHYPIINTKLELLRGEELKRVFDFRMTITNPNAISEVEDNKKKLLLENLTQIIQDTSASEAEMQEKLTKLSDYYSYEWQDLKEMNDNYLLKHYIKELNVPILFNSGFMDAMIAGEEIYQCDIVGGDLHLEKLNPKEVTVYKSGYSNKIEDADIVIIEKYLSPSQVIDMYGESLTQKDINYLENQGNDGDGETDPKNEFINIELGDSESVYTNGEGDHFYFDPYGEHPDLASSDIPFDIEGNVRVIKMYWKSRRKIKKVKSFDPVTGEETVDFYPEDYQIKDYYGETEEIFYINEAWEGVKIGKGIYVNMQPRPIQYNRLSNPSKCHFGIIGTIYNLNDDKPYCLVDIMRPFNNMYDVVHDRLNRLIAKNWGKLVRVDFAKIPKGWTMDKWLYFAKKNSMLVEDSFKEGNMGQSTGILAGSLNNNTTAVVDAELASSITTYINLLSFIKEELAETVGISRQREGSISNRETVGGIERSTLQSSYITEWLFALHDDVKKRVLECMIETLKIALKGRSKKFMHILPDHTRKIIEIDGDEFAETDHGIVMDNSEGMQMLNQRIDTLAQAALQNQLLGMSAIMKLYNTASLAEKIRMIEKGEREMQERAEQMQRSQSEALQQENASKERQLQMQMDHELQLNLNDNNTKLEIARMGIANTPEKDSPLDHDKFNETIREFNESLKIEKEKLAISRKQLAEKAKAFNKK
jgi:hypothetical protein